MIMTMNSVMMDGGRLVMERPFFGLLPGGLRNNFACEESHCDGAHTLLRRARMVHRSRFDKPDMTTRDDCSPCRKSGGCIIPSL
jgi:hypothetical protein